MTNTAGNKNTGKFVNKKEIKFRIIGNEAIKSPMLLI